MSAVPTIRKLLLAAIFALAFINSFPATPSATSAQVATVPPPPASRADRFGVYHWNINNAAMPADGSTNELNWGADLVAELGTRTIRIALVTRDDYRLNTANNLDLVQLAQLPAYDKVLRDARFRTIMLTTYSRGDMASNWSDGYTQAEYDAERDEIRRLGEYLLGNPAFAGKTFIILNWEGDNAISLWPNKRTIWDAYTNWIRSRVEGVKLARQKFPSGHSADQSANSAKLFSGLEFTQLRSWQTGELCGAPAGDPVRTDPLRNRCVLDTVAPQVEVDYYSYSSWRSLDDKVGNPAENLKQRFKSDLNFALSLIKAKRPEIGEHNFIIGEYGFERARYGECQAANHTSEMFDALEGEGAFQASYAIFWQIVDNAPNYGVGVGLFGLHRVREGRLSLSPIGENFRKRLAGESATNYTGCPQIRTSPGPGVLNNQGLPNFQINPDTVISIYAQGCCTNVTTPFSPMDNVVHFNQTARQFSLPRDNAEAFYESPTQINFSMPSERQTGFALVFVTDARGYDSNSETIAVTCADCPRFASSCGLLETVYQTLHIAPGDAITVTGENFSTSGNTIVIEQRVTQHTFQKWTLPRQNLLSESPTEIRAKLPGDLVPDRDTILSVINAQGRESTESIIPISQPCQSNDCPARLKPCGAIAPDSGALFTAGSRASISGRFSTGGNKIVLEQVDQQNRVYRYELAAGSQFWVESDRQIRFSLPPAMFAGRALFYVIDAQGRESRAQEFLVSQGLLTVVSAANYRGQQMAVESIATIFGAAMATTTQIAMTTPLPTELAGTRVVIKDSAGVERAAPLFFISPNQINFQLPAGTATGTATVTVFSGFGSSSSGPLQLVNIYPGLFTADASGKGVAAAVVLRIKPDGTQIYETVADFDPVRSAFVPRPIELGPEGEQVFIALFGTGIRNRSSLSGISTQIGGTSADVTYAGSHDTFVGLDQINARLPRNLAGRGDVDVTVSVDGLFANIVKVSIK